MQCKPRNTRDVLPPPEDRKRKGRIFPRVSEEHGSDDTLIIDF
jgi:hypothetical protein